MKSILHLSDLHFGTEDDATLAGLWDDIRALRPRVVAVSGDLTQRARTHQFRAAKAFLESLPAPYVVVPGNHDVPLYNLIDRWFRPLRAYRAHLSAELAPAFYGDDLAMMGIATAHGRTIKNGKFEDAHLDHVCRRMSGYQARWKILVTHHPFVIPHGVEGEPIEGARAALPRLEACGVDLILTGHMHVAYASDTTGFRSDDHKVIQVHAGTAISRRLRGEPNGYNRLDFDGDVLTLVARRWDGRRFVDDATKIYRRTQRDGEITFAKLGQSLPHEPTRAPVTST